MSETFLPHDPGGVDRLQRCRRRVVGVVAIAPPMLMPQLQEIVVNVPGYVHQNCGPVGNLVEYISDLVVEAVRAGFHPGAQYLEFRPFD